MRRKAYWLGFIWCDGSNIKRKRNKKITYEIKLDLATKDKKHLEKLKKFLKSNHNIKQYKHFSFGKEHFFERLLVSNSYLGKILDEKYGMVSHRHSCKKLIKATPEHLVKHFIRGIIDAEGSLTLSYTHDYSVNEYYMTYKVLIGLTTYEELIDFIQEFLFSHNIISSKTKKTKRHESRDEYCVQIKYCGNNNTLKLLKFLYEDANIYLDRKYQKFLEIKKTLETK